MKLQLLCHRKRDEYFLRGSRQGAFNNISREKIPVISAFEHHALESRIGLEHTGFGDERHSSNHMRERTQLAQKAVRYLDGLHVVRVVIIKGNNLYMRPETGYLVRNSLLESHHDTDGQNHHNHPDNHTSQCYSNSGARVTIFAALRKIKT